MGNALKDMEVIWEKNRSVVRGYWYFPLDKCGVSKIWEVRYKVEEGFEKDEQTNM